MFELSVSRATRGHPFKVAYPDSRINERANSFTVRVIALWDRLLNMLYLRNNAASSRGPIIASFLLE